MDSVIPHPPLSFNPIIRLESLGIPLTAPLFSLHILLQKAKALSLAILRLRNKFMKLSASLFDPKNES
jgi:hypothetical protein